MADYRFFFLDRAGHISKPAIIAACSDDEMALAEAGKLLKASTIEIWTGARWVATLPPIFDLPPDPREA